MTDATLEQPVSRCMTDAMFTIPQWATLRTAAMEMRSRRVGLLLVVEDQELVGVLSERDVVTAVADHDDLDTVRAADRARGSIVTIPAEAHLREALERMMETGTRHLIVTDELGQPRGVVSSRDLVSELSQA